MVMADNLLQIDPTIDPMGTPSSSMRMTDFPKATTNPYDSIHSPVDIFNYLPPDGSKFGLYSDPYATLLYYQPKQGQNHGRYWLEQRIEENSFTDKEITLIDYLSTHRLASRNQIMKVVFQEEDKIDKVRDFIKKCRNRGIITAFSWKTPCIDEKKKPLIYGLTKVGCDAAEVLFHRRVPKDFQFQPVEYRLKGPSMTTFFHDLVCNEFYCELKRLGRVIEWNRKSPVKLKDGTSHHPYGVVELIKDAGEFLTFWVEPIRLTPDWQDVTIRRFRYTQSALEKLSLDSQPKRVIVIVDSDSRIPQIAKLASEFMPSAEVRYTTDERLLLGIGKETFLSCDGKSLKRSPIQFLLPEHDGMTASEYFAQQTMDIEDEDFED